MAGRLRLGHLVQIAEPVIVLRPVHERDVASVRTRNKLLLRGNPAVHPQIQSTRGSCVWWNRVEAYRTSSKSLRIAHRPAKKVARPCRLKLWHVIAPEAIFF